MRLREFTTQLPIHPVHHYFHLRHCEIVTAFLHHREVREDVGDLQLVQQKAREQKHALDQHCCRRLRGMEILDALFLVPSDRLFSYLIRFWYACACSCYVPDLNLKIQCSSYELPCSRAHRIACECTRCHHSTVSRSRTLPSPSC